MLNMKRLHRILPCRLSSRGRKMQLLMVQYESTGKHNYVNVLVPTVRDYCIFPIMQNCSLDAEMS